MYFALTPEQRQRQDELRLLLDERMPESAVRELMADPAGDDPWLWPEVALLAARIDPVDIGAAMEVLGERLYVGPYLSSAVMGALLLSRAGRRMTWARWSPAGVESPSVRPTAPAPGPRRE